VDAAIIDTDVHPVLDPERVPDFLPEPWRRRFSTGNRGAGHLGYWNPNGVMRADAVTPEGERIEASPTTLGRYFLDVYDVEYAILNPETAMQDWLPADDRLRASLVVSPADPELAAREIHRLGDHSGFVQVLLPSAARIPYGQRFYHPIYAAAAEHGLPVGIHAGSEGVGLSGPPTAAGYPTSYFEWHTGLVASYIAHLISLVTEGVFVKFPSLKVVLVEGGVSWLPPILWRFDKNWKGLRQTTPWLTRPPSAIVSEHILMTTQPLEEPEHPAHFKAIVEMFDAEHMLMFSSDYPHWDGDTPDFAARRFVPALRPKVLGETARALYGLPPAGTPGEKLDG
jgi:uncharacterized protein